MKIKVEDLESFTCEAVVHRFRETWDVSLEEAEELFGEMKKWIWLSAHQSEQAGRVRLAISQSTKLIDEMWHTFILFTKDYHQFCDQYFGTYIHHIPTPKAVYDEAITRYEHDPDAVIAETRELFARQYELIYDVLGERTLVKWYDEYRDKYTDQHLQEIWRWSFSPYDTRVRETTRVESVRVQAPAAPGAVE